jgi:hypothetical protein
MIIGDHFLEINLETNGLAFKFICMVKKKIQQKKIEL